MNPRALVSRLLEWFARNARDLPWRRTQDPYAIWVSEIMLQQTQVKTVLPYWSRWMEELPNLTAVASAKPERLHKLWEGLGYYTRVRNLQRAAQLIVQVHGSTFPRSFEEILALPGIGRYTAGAIVSIAFNQPKPILDGNVMRLLSRAYGIEGNPREPKTSAKLWHMADLLIKEAAAGCRPRNRHRTSQTGRERANIDRPCSALNQALMELGALVCTPKQPRCTECPISRLCVACRQDRVHELPAMARRPRTTQRRFAAFIAQRDGRLLVRQRPAGVVNAHLWEFPNTELAEPALIARDRRKSSLHQAALKELGWRPGMMELLCTIKHSITRYRISLDAYRVEPNGQATVAKPANRWLTPKQMQRLAFTSAHKQVLQRAL